MAVLEPDAERKAGACVPRARAPGNRVVGPPRFAEGWLKVFDDKKKTAAWITPGR